MTESDDLSDGVAELVAVAADEFRERMARGENPDPEEYVARHPEAAGVLRQVLAQLRGTRGKVVAVRDRDESGILGDYRIVREVGRGGMGVVYEAEQISLRRRVALKVLPLAAVLDSRTLQRFRNEALAAAALDHPNVVKVFAVGCDRGVHHIAMQFVDGRTLADLIRELRGPEIAKPEARTPRPAGEKTATHRSGGEATVSMPAAAPTATVAHASTARTKPDRSHFRRVAELMAQAADALEHAHALGIVHRDVKPGNLLVDGRGHLWVADFGLAQVSSDPGLTHTGDLLGTPRYMSPEQAEAKHNLVDHRTDIYALGATLYELLTGEAAVRGVSREEILRRIASDEPVPPRRIEGQIPRPLETVVLKAMTKDPARRYQSARELADDLRRFLDHRPVPARPPSLAERMGNWSRRHRAVVRAVLAALIVAVAALATSTLLISRAYESEARHRADAEEAAVRADKARQEVSDREKRLRLEHYPTDLIQARHAWEASDPAWLRELLDRQLPRDGEPDLRGFEWHYLDACAQDKERVFTGHEFPLLSADMTGDGRLVATSDRGGVVKLWDAASGRELRSARYSEQEVTCVRFSPDGRTLATCGVDQTIRLFNVDTWAESARLVGHTGTVTAVCWSPADKRLASVGRDHAVKVWDVAKRTVARSMFGHTDAVLCVAWSPDGKLLASAGKDPVVRLWNPTKGSLAGVLTGHEAGEPLCLAFNRSGKYLACGGYHGRVIVHDVNSKRPRYTFDAGGTVWSVAFSPDDSYLLVGRAGGIEAWDTSNSSQVLRVRTLPHPGRARALAFSRDGGTLLTASEEEREARLGDVSKLTGYSRLCYATACLTVSPDSGLAVFGEPNATTVLRRFPGGELVRPLGGRVMDNRGVGFSPAGNLLVLPGLDGKLNQWDMATGQRLGDLTGHPRFTPQVLSVSPGGSFIVCVGLTQTHVWRQDTGQLVTTIGQHGFIAPPAFSPDGSVLATTDGARIVLWKVGTWSRQTVLEGIQDTHALAFSPDSRVLAAGGHTNGVTLWEIGTGRRLGVLAERTGPIKRVAFSPDGQTLATLGEDRTVRLWHVPTQRELFTLYRHDAPLKWVQFASPTRLLVMAQSANSPQQSEVLVFPPLDR